MLDLNLQVENHIKNNFNFVKEEDIVIFSAQKPNGEILFKLDSGELGVFVKSRLCVLLTTEGLVEHLNDALKLKTNENKEYFVENFIDDEKIRIKSEEDILVEWSQKEVEEDPELIHSIVDYLVEIGANGMSNIENDLAEIDKEAEQKIELVENNRKMKKKSLLPYIKNDQK